MINDTHRAGLRSWVEAANDGRTDFPIQNLPFGVFRDWEGDDSPRVGVAIGDRVLDVSALRAGLFSGPARRAVEACAEPVRLSQLLSTDHEDSLAARRSVETALYAMTDVEMLVPADVGDFTDFYASVFHASNVGSMFRPDNPLLPNYKHVPIGYHGRASSIVVSGASFKRPSGQTMADDAQAPSFGPSRLLDYEVEIGAFVGPGNPRGESVALRDARSHLFGLCLVNDWSARDIQKWEYQPLGPFLAKNFATTVSPWIVTMEALAPFGAPAFARPAGDPAPLPYLSDEDDRREGGLDITIEAFIETPQMRADGFEGMRVSRANFRDMYWTLGQMLAHHTSNGCNLRPGDLVASGTVSGEARESAGCLLERTWRGTEPVELPSGEKRKFLEDGDTVIIRAYCIRDGAVRIGFGECRGTVLPA
jgi:fumarylacetoacetase